jgi:hypothetical protein
VHTADHLVKTERQNKTMDPTEITATAQKTADRGESAARAEANASFSSPDRTNHSSGLFIYFYDTAHNQMNATAHYKRAIAAPQALFLPTQEATDRD